MDVSALDGNTGDGASQGAGMMPNCSSAAATVLLSENVDGSVENYISNCADCFDIRRFNDMFSDGQNVITYDRLGVKRDTSIGGCNPHWHMMQFYCLVTWI